MKAMILAAGLGTRLQPLTNDVPKALIRINGYSLLELAIYKVKDAGFNELIVNVHHHAGQIIDFLEQLSLPGISVRISDERENLLDTGGAILRAREFLDGNEPFLVHNVDVVSNIDLRALYREHSSNHRLATLAVLDRQTRRYLLFDDDNLLRGWTDTLNAEVKWAGIPVSNTRQLAFCGIHVISPDLFRLTSQTGRFSVIDTYLSLASKSPVMASTMREFTWFDLGKPSQIKAVEEFLQLHPGFTPLL